jgi:hypothetical protein
MSSKNKTTTTINQDAELKTSKKQKQILALSLVLTTVLGFLFFDANVSTGGDDALYIQRAYDFIHKGAWPEFQGPLYPIFISIFTYVFGINLFVLKVVSLLATLGFLYFFYQTFKYVLPKFLLVGSLFIFAINASLLYYASQTYNEAFFLFMQMAFIYLFKIKILDDWRDYQWNDYKKFIIIALFLILLFLTKTVAIAALPAVLFFFSFYKKFKAAMLTLGAFFLLFLAYQATKQFIFTSEGLQMSSQGSSLLLQNPYDPSQGKEDISGFLTRFFTNSNQYISQQFYKFLGLRADKYVLPNYTFLTFFTFVLFFAGMYFFYRNSRTEFFLGMYLLIILGATFIVLQALWNQERLIVPFAPLAIVFLLHTIYGYLSKYKIGNAKTISMILVSILLVAGSIKTLGKLPNKVDQIMSYIDGNRLQSFSPDWQHYIEMCQYSANNLPEGSLTAVRKPGIAFIYAGGHKFYGIYRVESNDPEVLYQKLKDAGVTHVIVASLRLVPEQNTGRVITTIRKYLGLVRQKYPEKLQAIHKIGEEEPAYLFELK